MIKLLAGLLALGLLLADASSANADSPFAGQQGSGTATFAKKH